MRDAADAAGTVPATLARASGKPWVFHVIRFGRRYPLGAFGAIMLVFLSVVAVLAPQIAPFDPVVQDVPNRLRPPSSEYLLGTDEFGRDAFSRLVFGARISLYVGFLSVTLGSVVGTIIGIASGYLGGRFDLLVQRVVDAFMGFPSLVFTMMLVIALGASINNVTLAIAVNMSPRIIRVSRSSALTVKEEVYVLATKAIGAKTWRVMLRHVLPNCMAPIFVLSTGYLGSAIVSEASLSFLGLGVPPPNPSWGALIQVGTGGYLWSAPWLSLVPGVALSVVVFAFAFFGDALRDAFDPRLRGR